MNIQPEVFDIRAAAAFLGVHEQTVRRLARRGAIPAFKVGRDWRFRRLDLQRWSENQRPRGGLYSVLVIDDDEEVCNALVRSLEAVGCQARQATGGRQGLDLVYQEPPDLILLDLFMPDMTGPRFLQQLRQTHPALPVVIVTGHPNSDLMLESSQYAPLMMLAKPVDHELLERTVRVVTGHRTEAIGK
jgi:excisionase family DNA binding protein